jgi:DNA-binding NarL/FixJ family response regulator
MAEESPKQESTTEPRAAGPSLDPHQVWEAMQHGDARLLDLRTALERRRYGAPPGAVPVSLARHARLVNRARPESRLDELTEREREVLALMAEGRSNRGICERLFLSPKTVEAHVKHIFMKLDIDESGDDHRRVLAVLAFLRS